jgi:hypothetical protein
MAHRAVAFVRHAPEGFLICGAANERSQTNAPLIEEFPQLCPHPHRAIAVTINMSLLLRVPTILADLVNGKGVVFGSSKSRIAPCSPRRCELTLSSPPRLEGLELQA